MSIRTWPKDEVFQAQARLVELIAAEEPFDTLLKSLVLFVEQFASESRCAILIADPVTGKLRLGAAPNLPPAQATAVDASLFRQGQSAPGPATARHEVVVSHIASSPLPDHRGEAAGTAGPAVSWTVPLVNKTNGLIGTFSMYCDEDREPRPAELELMRIAASFAGIVIQRFRDAEIQRSSELRYRELVERCPDPVIAHVKGRLIYVNQAARTLLNLEEASLRSDLHLEHFIPAHLRQQIRTHHTGRLSTRLQVGSGQLLHVEIAAARLTLEHQPATILVIRDVSQRIALESALLEAEGRQQEHLAFDLHDGVGQQLTGISLLLGAVSGAATATMPAKTADFQILAELVCKSISDVRILAGTMSRHTVERVGLAGALNLLKQKAESIYGLKAQLSLQPEAGWTIDSNDANDLFRIVQEAIGNVARHAKAATVAIHARVKNGHLIITIADDGIGITDAVFTATGLGLRSMRHRAERIGGQFEIRPLLPHGTTVQIKYPLPADTP